MTEIPRRQREAFTLVEMLVALAILSIIVLMVSAVLSGVLTTWQQARARDERRTVARQALNLMARDVRMAVLPSNPIDTKSIQFLIDPTAATLSAYLLPHAIFFQAPVSTDGSSASFKGNLAIVGYFIRWVGTDASLCRLLINPSAPTTDYLVYSTPNTWVTKSLLDEYAPADSGNSYKGLVGENVIGLWFQALDSNGNPITTTAAGSTTTYNLGSYDSRLGYSMTTNAVTYAYGPSALPPTLRMGVAVIDSGTARRLSGPLTPVSTGNFDKDIQQFVSSLPQSVQRGVDVYTETVTLPHFPQ